MSDKLSGAARLTTFLKGPVEDFYVGQGFVRTRHTFRLVSNNGDTSIIMFKLDRTGRSVENEVVILVEVAIVPPIFAEYTAHLYGLKPAKVLGTMYGMWRSWIAPPAIPTDEDGEPLWPYLAWRFTTDAEEEECRIGVLAQSRSVVDLIRRLISDHSYWLSVAAAPSDEVQLPSTIGRLAEIMLLVPDGASTRLYDVLHSLERDGFHDLVDWSIDYLESHALVSSGYQSITVSRAGKATQSAPAVPAQADGTPESWAKIDSSELTRFKDSVAGEAPNDVCGRSAVVIERR